MLRNVQLHDLFTSRVFKIVGRHILKSVKMQCNGSIQILMNYTSVALLGIQGHSLTKLERFITSIFAVCKKMKNGT